MIKKMFPVTILFLLLMGCQPLKMELPEGFARYQDSPFPASLLGDGDIRAISPEGLNLRVRLAENSPPQEGAFWQEALRTQMLKEGYQLLDEGLLERDADYGFYMEWGAPLGRENYIYLTAVLVGKNRMAIAEAAGPVSLYREKREALYDSLETVRF